MLLAYKTGMIRATQGFKLGVIAATGGWRFSISWRWFSAFVPHSGPGDQRQWGRGNRFQSLCGHRCGAKSGSRFRDMIESGVQGGAPKYMEWYGRFGLMVTLIWLYLEILRLLGKARRR